ncbi:MAG: hypothetical protein ACK5NT_03175 [Pyrinomonadaceae bacterium]
MKEIINFEEALKAVQSGCSMWWSNKNGNIPQSVTRLCWNIKTN